MSPVYSASPVVFSKASARSISLPMIESSLSKGEGGFPLTRSRGSGLAMACTAPLNRCCVKGGFDNVRIGAAPAINSFNSPLDILLARRRVKVQQNLERHQNGGSTEAALNSIKLDECVLERVKPLRSGQRLDRYDSPPLCFHSKHGAGEDGGVIH